MKTAFSVRLDPVDLAKLDVLRHGGSREQWFRNMIQAAAKSRAAIEEAAIRAFVQAAKDGEDAGDYRNLIAKAEADLAILRREN